MAINKTPHTQLPNLIQDLVLPLLTDGEKSCLLYIVRRTTGFVGKGGQRKAKDRISLSQFQHGIQTGDYVLDLGTGLSRPAIINALRELSRKGLIEVGHICPRCYWERDSSDDETPVKGKIHCPRCGRTCEREFALKPLSARSLLEFLNNHDPRGRLWDFDKAVRRFTFQDPQALPSDNIVSKEDLDRYRKMFSTNEIANLTNQLIKQMQEVMKDNKRLTNKQVLDYFYKPILEMQETAGTRADLVEEALRGAFSRGIAAQLERVVSGDKVSFRHNYRWHRYALKILRTRLADPAVKARLSGDEARIGLVENERLVREILQRAAKFNQDNDPAPARDLLSQVLAHSKNLAGFFADRQAIADASLRQAFKMGDDDFRSAYLNMPSAIYDYYPEWQWPEELIP